MQKILKLHIYSTGDPDVGIRASSYTVDCPFHREDVDQIDLDSFANRMIKAYSDYGVEGAITHQYIDEPTPAAIPLNSKEGGKKKAWAKIMPDNTKTMVKTVSHNTAVKQIEIGMPVFMLNGNIYRFKHFTNGETKLFTTTLGETFEFNDIASYMDFDNTEHEIIHNLTTGQVLILHGDIPVVFDHFVACTNKEQFCTDSGAVYNISRIKMHE